jgi:hypothetical protein
MRAIEKSEMVPSHCFSREGRSQANFAVTEDGHSEVCVERPFFAVYGHQVSHEFAGHGQCGPVAISFLFRALVNQRRFRVPHPLCLRQEAVRRGLWVAGTLSVLDEADQAGLVSFDQAVAQLRKTNFRVSGRHLRNHAKAISLTQLSSRNPRIPYGPPRPDSRII